MSYTIVVPHEGAKFTNVMLLALVTWREASNQTKETKTGVAWAVRNRVDNPGWYGKTYFEVITKYCQFTSMVPPKGMLDPNLVRYPGPTDKSWLECLEIAFDVMTSNVKDPTGGATYYFDKSLDKNPPKWAKEYVHLADIGDIHFYRPKKGQG